jgi:hypothetical protein
MEFAGADQESAFRENFERFLERPPAPLLNFRRRKPKLTTRALLAPLEMLEPSLSPAPEIGTDGRKGVECNQFPSPRQTARLSDSKRKRGNHAEHEIPLSNSKGATSCVLDSSWKSGSCPA